MFDKQEYRTVNPQDGKDGGDKPPEQEGLKTDGDKIAVQPQLKSHRDGIIEIEDIDTKEEGIHTSLVEDYGTKSHVSVHVRYRSPSSKDLESSDSRIHNQRVSTTQEVQDEAILREVGLKVVRAKDWEALQREKREVLQQLEREKSRRASMEMTLATLQRDLKHQRVEQITSFRNERVASDRLARSNLESFVRDLLGEWKQGGGVNGWRTLDLPAEEQRFLDDLHIDMVTHAMLAGGDDFANAFLSYANPFGDRDGIYAMLYPGLDIDL